MEWVTSFFWEFLKQGLMFHLESINMSYEVEWKFRLMVKKKKKGNKIYKELKGCETGKMNCKLQHGGQKKVTNGG